MKTDKIARLHGIARMIEERSGGKQECLSDFSGCAYISASDDANTGILLRKHTDFKTGECRLEFQGYLARMGIYMSSAGMQAVADEVKQLADILAELEREPLVFSEEDLAKWSVELLETRIEKRIEKSNAQAFEREPQLDHTMGMM